jgi:hypothetical protein
VAALLKFFMGLALVHFQKYWPLSGRFFSNFVAFSEYPNFIKRIGISIEFPFNLRIWDTREYSALKKDTSTWNSVTSVVEFEAGNMCIIFSLVYSKKSVAREN